MALEADSEITEAVTEKIRNIEEMERVQSINPVVEGVF